MNLKRRGRPKSNQQDKDGIPEASSLVFSPEEIQEAELYFFKKATGEVRTFAKKRDYFDQSQEIEGVIYFTGRLLSSNEIVALEKVMFDLNPTSFCVPVVDRYSPVAYSIMMEVHWSTVHHLNATRTYKGVFEPSIYHWWKRPSQRSERNLCFLSAV